MCSAFKQNPNFSRTHHVLEIGGNGQIVRDLDTAIGSLDRAAHLDIDAAGRVYAASTPNLLEVQADFSAFRTMPAAFNRSSGVAMGPDDKVYATDQNLARAVVFNQAREFERFIPLGGGVMTGADFGPDGGMYFCRWSSGALVRLDVATNAFTTVVSGRTRISDVEFASDGSYYISWENGGIIEHRSAQHALLETVNTFDAADSLVMYVPEPASSAVVLALVLRAVAARPRRGARLGLPPARRYKSSTRHAPST